MTIPNAIRSFAPVAFVVVAGFGLVSCQPVQRAHGKSGIMATYNGFQLVSLLPAEVSVQAAAAAADEAFRDQGYSVAKLTTTDQEGEVVAHPARSGDFPKVRVRIEAKDGATRVIITKEPFNEEAVCRGTLSRMLAKLGL